MATLTTLAAGMRLRLNYHCFHEWLCYLFCFITVTCGLVLSSVSWYMVLLKVGTLEAIRKKNHSRELPISVKSCSHWDQSVFLATCPANSNWFAFVGQAPSNCACPFLCIVRATSPCDQLRGSTNQKSSRTVPVTSPLV